jgi:sterol desaturase/sphingolipid hydroxylase (fatty acid hydroxylase superfamily)
MVGRIRPATMISVSDPATPRAFIRTLYLPTLVLTGVTGWLAWRGWSALGTGGSWAAVRAGQLRYAGPVVLGFVAVVIVLEQCWPAVRRPITARGHLMDLAYLAAYALVVLPLVTLIGTGFAGILEVHAPWLMLPHVAGVPRCVWVLFGLLAIDATDWFVHLVNHKINPLWRFHAVHHSQEEVSVLTTFRAHPLVHLSFALTAVPGFVLVANAATPATLLTIYACLGALPHANLGWTYGLLGRLVISPAYHRAHHRSTGRTDVNLGVVFAIWDAGTRRAIFPTPAGTVIETGLAGRPVPVEQDGAAPRLGRVFLAQWLEPFARSTSRADRSLDRPVRVPVPVPVPK